MELDAQSLRRDLDTTRADEARLHAALRAATCDAAATQDAVRLQGEWLQARARRLQLEARLEALPADDAATPNPVEADPVDAAPSDPRHTAIAAGMRRVVLDMKRQFVAVKREVALAIADERRLARALEAKLAHVARWEERAAMAERAGKPELHREAQDERQRHAATARAARARWQAMRDGVDVLRERLRELHERVERAEARTERLLSERRLRRAELLTEASATIFARIDDAHADLVALLLPDA